MSDWGIGTSLVGLALWGVVMTAPPLTRLYLAHPWLRITCLVAQRATKLAGCLLSMGLVQVGGCMSALREQPPQSVCLVADSHRLQRADRAKLLPMHCGMWQQAWHGL